MAVPQAGSVMARLGRINRVVTIQVDPSSLSWWRGKLKKAVSRGLDKAAKELRVIAREIKQSSQDQVPYDEGNLHDSAHYLVRRFPHYVTARIWYDEDKAPYALMQHETPPSIFRHEAGRKWKYLEDPVTAREDDLEELFRDDFQVRVN